ncbi:vacuolar iron transporter-like protein [Thalictrum thalictroides]|uniref:Vacuolar iron transporter n=1 Tax=Thalictrum thalictroides TaxID=46969 RepID=A0A7J6V6H1_THATH|nr:vacuolar iron transporter-like protein [Thalictrum thalictroides]
MLSVYSQLDIERAHMKRVVNAGKERLPNPLQAALASALAFCIGAMLPLLAAAAFQDKKYHKLMLGVVAGSSSLGLLAFGAGSAVLGNAPVMRCLLGDA